MQPDVIIVGAGPGGSAAAITLAKNGHKVLLLDRKEFPRDKVCGDGLLPGSVRFLNKLGLKDQIQTAGFNPINEMMVISPENSTINISITPRDKDTQFYIAPRKDFDVLLQRKAVASGAKFLIANAHEPVITNGVVTGINIVKDGRVSTFTSKILIGADGSSSAMARTLAPQIHKVQQRILWRRGYISGLEIDPQRAEFYFIKEIAPCGAWIFPISATSANIGLGQYQQDYIPKQKNLNDLMEIFLNHPRIKPRLSANWKISNSKSWYYHLATWNQPRIAFDGALLVGDAASFLDPFSGEGIKNALHSGIIAGEIVDEALRKKDYSYSILSGYERRCKKEIYSVIRRSLAIKKCFELFPMQMVKLFNRINNPNSLTHRFIEKQSGNFHIGGDASN